MTHDKSGCTPSQWGHWGGVGLVSVMAAALGLATAGPNVPAPPLAAKHAAIDPAVSARLERHLAKLDITGALAYYDTLSVPTDTSVDILKRIARADLFFCLREGKGWDRFEAVRILAEHGDPAGLAALAEYVRSETAAFRTAAMDLLTPPAAAEIIVQLKARSTDPRSQPFERVRAARALHRLGEKAAAMQALQALLDSKDFAERSELVGVLAALEDPAAREPLKVLLADPAPTISLVAALGLMRLGEPAGREHLLGALADPLPQVRLLAAWHLAQAHDQSGLAAAKQLVDEGFALYPKLDSLQYELEWAVYVLSWIDPAVARPSLDRLANSAGWFAAEVIAGRRLAELGDPQGLAVLERLDSEVKNNTVMTPYRVDVLRYAGWLGDLPGVRALARGAVDDPSPLVRGIAMEVLARLGDPAALPAARQMLGGVALIYRSRAAAALLEFGNGPERAPGAGEIPETVPRHGAVAPSADAGKPVQGAEKTGFCG